MEHNSKTSIVRITANPQKQEELANWFKEDHFPKVAATGCVRKISRKIEPGADVFYNIHTLEFTSEEKKKEYETVHRPTLSNEFAEKWDGHVSITKDFEDTSTEEIEVLFELT